jgi:sulfur relay (sulfurtransferase) complex TusBCD TusD component (DsrE family)
MKFIQGLMLMCILCATLNLQPTFAGNKDYLIINLTSYTTTESRKAIDYAKAELSRGRPVVIFLQEQGVWAASKAHASRFKEQQQSLNELIRKGATVLVCPHCMKLYGVDEADLLAGVQIAGDSAER